MSGDPKIESLVISLPLVSILNLSVLLNVKPSYTAISVLPPMSSELQSALEFLQTNNYTFGMVVHFGQ